MNKKKWVVILRNNRVVDVIWASSEQEALEHAGNLHGGDRFPEFLRRFARAYTLENLLDHDKRAPLI